MKYMGSKNRLSKYLLPIILKDFHKYCLYWEPFVGGGNMIDKVSGIYRLGTDIDYDVISALNMIKKHLDKIPKDNSSFSEADYKNIKGSGHLLEGYVAYALSYGGKKWGGWRRDKEGKRDYVAEAYKNAVKQSKLLQKDITFKQTNYFSVKADDVLIYCDPPYRGTTKYNSNFDHDRFYSWCRKQKEKGNKIFISEYWMPEDFTCVWEKEIVSSLTKDTGSKRGVEKLYTL